MLKFSGFADLTSCLEGEVQEALDVRVPFTDQSTCARNAFPVADRKEAP